MAISVERGRAVWRRGPPTYSSTWTRKTENWPSEHEHWLISRQPKQPQNELVIFSGYFQTHAGVVTRGRVGGGVVVCAGPVRGTRKCYFKWCDRGQRAESICQWGRGGGGVVANFTFSYLLIACHRTKKCQNILLKRTCNASRSSTQPAHPTAWNTRTNKPTNSTPSHSLPLSLSFYLQLLNLTHRAKEAAALGAAAATATAWTMPSRRRAAAR